MLENWREREAEREHLGDALLFPKDGAHGFTVEELARDTSGHLYLPPGLEGELWLANRLGKVAEGLENCGKKGRARACSDCGEIEEGSSRVFHCDVNLCPGCAARRSEALERFLPLLAEAATKKPGLRFMTLDAPSVRELVGPEGNVFSILWECFADLRQLLEKTPVCRACDRWAPTERSRSRWKAGGWKRRLSLCECEAPHPILRAVSAALRSGESTFNANVMVCKKCSLWRRPKRGKTGCECEEPEFEIRHPGWHPHVHVIVAMPFVPQAALANAWTEITRVRWPGGPANGMGVDIRTVRDKAGRDGRDAGFNARDALKELLKYPAKAADLAGDPEAFTQWVHATRRTKFVRASGEWAKWQGEIDELEPKEEPECCGGCGSRALVPYFYEIEARARE